MANPAGKTVPESTKNGENENRARKREDNPDPRPGLPSAEERRRTIKPLDKNDSRIDGNHRQGRAP